jgi:hypothetical protein
MEVPEAFSITNPTWPRLSRTFSGFCLSGLVTAHLAISVSMYLHLLSPSHGLMAWDDLKRIKSGERASPGCPPLSSSLFLELSLVLFTPPVLHHEKRRTAHLSRYQHCAFGPTVLDVAGVGGEGVLGGVWGGGSYHSFMNFTCPVNHEYPIHSGPPLPKHVFRRTP